MTEDATNLMNEAQTKGQGMVIGLEGLATDLATAIGGAIGTGDFEALGDNILKSFGSFLTQLGQLMVAQGAAYAAIDIGLTNPLALIAAGTAAIAIGSAISSMTSKNPVTSSGGGYSQSYGGGDSTSNSMLFNRAGQITSGYASGKQQQTVRFKVAGQDLVAVMKNNNVKSNI